MINEDDKWAFLIKVTFCATWTAVERQKKITKNKEWANKPKPCLLCCFDRSKQWQRKDVTAPLRSNQCSRMCTSAQCKHTFPTWYRCVLWLTPLVTQPVIQALVINVTLDLKWNKPAHQENTDVNDVLFANQGTSFDSRTEPDWKLLLLWKKMAH